VEELIAGGGEIYGSSTGVLPSLKFLYLLRGRVARVADRSEGVVGVPTHEGSRG